MPYEINQMHMKIFFTVKENEYLLPSRFITLKSSDVALGVRPGLFSEPYIVNVFPEPVWP
jgi:hypothetical protein